MAFRDRIAFPPVSFFGIPLGTLGFGLSWRAAIKYWDLPAIIAQSILALGVTTWLAVTVLYLAKWVWDRRSALEEFEHPVQCCFIGLTGVTTSLAGLAVQPASRVAAITLFLLGAGATLVFGVYRTGRLWMGGQEISATTAVLYLPAVAGSFVTATAASTLGWQQWGQLAFGAGMFSWLAIESVLLGRLYHGPALVPALRPTLGIQLAPPAVGALAYINVGSGQADIFVQAMIGYALLQALLLVRLWPWISEQPFSPSYWSFSFGIASLSGAIIRLAIKGGAVEQAIAAPAFIIANLVIAALLLRTSHLLHRGQLIAAKPRTNVAQA